MKFWKKCRLFKVSMILLIKSQLIRICVIRLIVSIPTQTNIKQCSSENSEWNTWASLTASRKLNSSWDVRNTTKRLLLSRRTSQESSRKSQKRRVRISFQEERQSKICLELQCIMRKIRWMICTKIWRNLLLRKQERLERRKTVWSPSLHSRVNRSRWWLLRSLKRKSSVSTR